MAIATVNPATGQVIKTFEPLSDAQIEVKLQRAADTFSSYKKVPFAERARMMLKAAAILESEKETFARMMTTEIPPQITTPDTVETRLGTLKFFDGFPDDQTVEKVMDNLDFSRGVQSFLSGLPGIFTGGNACWPWPAWSQ